MDQPSPERMRELAANVARSVLDDAGVGAIPLIDRNAVAVRIRADDIVGTWSELMDFCQDIAALARTAQITVTIPEGP